MLPASVHDRFEEAVVEAATKRRVTVQGVGRLMKRLGIPTDPDEAKSVGSFFWADAGPNDRLFRLLLALWHVEDTDMKRLGLSHHYAILDRLVAGYPDLPCLHDFARLLADSAASLVEIESGRLLGFLGSLPFAASNGRLRHGGFSICAEKAIGLAADEPAGIWRLRERLAAGHAEYDRLVCERWDALCGRATSTFEETVDAADGYELALAVYLERYRILSGTPLVPLSARLVPMLSKGR